MHIILCEIDCQSRFMHETGCLGLVHCDDPEGWDREGDERGVQDGEHMYICGRFMSMQNQYNIVISHQLNLHIYKNLLSSQSTDHLHKNGVVNSFSFPVPSEL